MATRTDCDLETLVRLARSGDVSAFSELARREQDAALACALSILGDLHHAQDATQEALVAAVLNLDRLSDPAAFPAWLRGIVRNQCRRVLRRRDLEMVSLDAAEFYPAREPSPASRLEQRQSREAVGGALDALPATLADVARLYYLHEFSQRQIAALLGLPITTVNNRLHAARARLKEGIIMPAQILAAPAPSHVPAMIGRVIAINGPVVEVRFEPGAGPDIFDALLAPGESGRAEERLKVAHRRDDGTVLAVATSNIEDVKPGTAVMNRGLPGEGLTPVVGVRPFSLADIERVVGIVGHPRQDRPALLETGIKPIDLLCPYPKQGNVALLGVQGVGRIVLVEELTRRLSGLDAAPRLFYFAHTQEVDSVRGMLTKEKKYPGDSVGPVQTFWMLSDSATDPHYAASAPCFDAATYCSPLLGIQGLFPAIDLLRSPSTLLDPAIVGREHFEVATRVKELLRQARQLMADPLLLEYLACRALAAARQRLAEFVPPRLAELPEDQRMLVSRARKLERFLTTPFLVAEPFTGIPAKVVSRQQTLQGCRAILDGELDEVPEQAFLYVGAIDEVRERAAKTTT